MSDLYDDFEKRFSNAWFSCSWQDVNQASSQAKGEAEQKKSLEMLQNELENLQDDMEKICAKQLVLDNLSKLYRGDLT